MKKDDFEKQMHQLIQLLSKLIRSYPGGSHAAEMLQGKAGDKLNLNLIFLNLMPMTNEEMDMLEEAMHQNLGFSADTSDDNPHTTQDVFDWNSGDQDFLKSHGMSF